jgi:hypothetical protein
MLFLDSTTYIQNNQEKMAIKEEKMVIKEENPS